MSNNIGPIALLLIVLIINNFPGSTKAKEIDIAKWDSLYSEALEDYNRVYEEYSDVSDIIITPDDNLPPEPEIQGESILGEKAEGFSMLEEDGGHQGLFRPTEKCNKENCPICKTGKYAEARKNRLVLLTGPDWCIPCIRFERDVIEELLKYPANGWIINNTPQAHIQKFLVDSEGNMSKEARKYAREDTKYPALVVIRNGKEVKRYHGLYEFTHKDMAKLITGTYGD